MEQNTTAKHGSVVQDFNRVLLWLYLIAILIAAPAIYFITSMQVRSQAERELVTLVDMVKSIQMYVASDLRPFFIKNDIFHAPGYSGIVATSLIAENFKGVQPDYYIKNASDNPLNPNNRPEPLERALLQEFRVSRSIKEITREGSISGKRMLISAAPKVSAKGCMLCHGLRSNAPQQIRDQFPGEVGYNYKPNDVVGVSVVGVPIANVQVLALKRTLIFLLILTVLFAMILIAVNRVVKRDILAPILKITQTAHDISHGKLEEPVQVDRNNEIGDLARSVELVRRSTEKMIQMMRK